ncbi:MAG: C25 family cysteine peptidase [Patescibacteria group bacterium]
MKERITTIMLVGLLLIPVVNVAWQRIDQYRTVHTSTVVNLLLWEFQFGDDSAPFDRMETESHLDMEKYYVTSPAPDTIPRFSIADFRSVISTPGISILAISSHGTENDANGPDGLMIEAYRHSADRDSALIRYVRRGQYSYPDDIYPAYFGYTGYYGIGVRPHICRDFAGDERSIVLAEYCFSALWLDEWGAGTAIGHCPELINTQAFASIDTFCTYLNAERGRTKRTVQHGYQHMFSTNGAWSIVGHDNTVLFPAVCAVYPDSGYVFQSSSFNDAYVEFDTPIEAEDNIEDILGMPSIYAELENIELKDSDTKLEYDIRVHAYGEFPRWVNWDKVKGRNSEDRYLNGNTDPLGQPPFYSGKNCRPPSHDDYVTAYYSEYGEPPAASVLGVTAVEEGGQVIVYWETESEKDTDYFQVKCSFDDGFTWQTVSEPIWHQGSDGQGAQYYWSDVVGQPDFLYQIVEMEISGNVLEHLSTEVLSSWPEPPELVEPVVYQPKYQTPPQPDGEPKDGGLTDPDVLCVCPADWIDHLDYWVYTLEYLEGHLVQFVALEDFGTTSQPQDIKDYILAMDPLPTHVVLWGDANRLLPGQNLIQSYYVLWDGCYYSDDDLYAWDGWYGDTDGDGQENIAVGRVPINTLQELWIVADKFVEWHLDRSGRCQAGLMIGNWNLSGCRGAYAETLAMSIYGQFDPQLAASTTIYRYSDDPFSYSARRDADCAIQNAGIDYKFYFSTLANRISNGSILTKWNNYFDMTYLVENWTSPIVFGFCCGMADFTRGESSWGLDMATDFLTAPGKGARAWMGPTDISDQYTNSKIFSYLAGELYMGNETTLGEATLAAKQLAYEECPQTHNQIRMYSILGDPTLPIGWQDIATGVAEATEAGFSFRLLPNHPNPFNPTTTIAYSLSQAGPVQLYVYDVAGRLVCNLVDEEQEAGQQAAVWQGRDNHGRAVASGVYFYRLETGQQCSSRKMVLLK